jgi:uncharacterized membrane protein
MRAHAAAAVYLWKEAGEPNAQTLVQQVLDDARTASVSDRDRALYIGIEYFTARRSELDIPVYDELHAAGWDDEAIFQALSVCALFCLYNAWVDGLGTDPLPDEAFAASGARLGKFGYAG